MKLGIYKLQMGSLVIAAALNLGMTALAQDGTKQDMKSAGHETKNATVDAGHGVATGTKKAYHKTKHVTKKAYHGTVHGTEKLGDKIAGKPAPQQ